MRKRNEQSRDIKEQEHEERQGWQKYVEQRDRVILASPGREVHDPQRFGAAVREATWVITRVGTFRALRDTCNNLLQLWMIAAKFGLVYLCYPAP